MDINLLMVSFWKIGSHADVRFKDVGKVIWDSDL